MKNHKNQKQKKQPIKEKEDLVEVVGTVVKVLPASMYRVKLDNGLEILGHMCGKMKAHFIKIGLGDKVKMELSQYDLTKGRIRYRIREDRAEAIGL